MPEPGWYDDPLIPGGLRYWDGAAWTDAAQPPETPDTTDAGGSPPAGYGSAPGYDGAPGFGAGPGLGGGPSIGGSPPFGTLPPGASATGSAGFSGELGDLGDWLSQTFRGMRDNVVELAVLFFVLPAIFWAVAYLLFHQLAANLTWVENEGFSGFDSGLLVAGGVALGATILASLVGSLAGHHLLYTSHIGQPTSLGSSLAVGLQRLPRMTGIVILLTLVFGLLLAAPTAILWIALTGIGARVALVLLAIIGFFGLIPAFIGLWVKTGFVPVSAAVTPSGTSAIRSSMEVSVGRFFSVFIRLGIIVAMASMLTSVVQGLIQFTAPAVLLSKVEFLEDDVLISGRSIGSIDQLQLADVMPHPVAALSYFTLYFLVASLGSALVASGSAAIYALAGGRNSFGHGSGGHVSATDMSGPLS